MRSNVPTLLYYKYFTLSNAGQTTLVYFTLQGERTGCRLLAVA
jgi:hypothetical protein